MLKSILHADKNIYLSLSSFFHGLSIRISLFPRLLYRALRALNDEWMFFTTYNADEKNDSLDKEKNNSKKLAEHVSIFFFEIINILVAISVTIMIGQMVAARLGRAQDELDQNDIYHDGQECRSTFLGKLMRGGPTNISVYPRKLFIRYTLIRQEIFISFICKLLKPSPNGTAGPDISECRSTVTVPRIV